eukprot:gene5894-6135_t
MVLPAAAKLLHLIFFVDPGLVEDRAISRPAADVNCALASAAAATTARESCSKAFRYDQKRSIMCFDFENTDFKNTDCDETVVAAYKGQGSIQVHDKAEALSQRFRVQREDCAEPVPAILYGSNGATGDVGSQVITTHHMYSNTNRLQGCFSVATIDSIQASFREYSSLRMTSISSSNQQVRSLEFLLSRVVREGYTLYQEFMTYSSLPSSKRPEYQFPVNDTLNKDWLGHTVILYGYGPPCAVAAVVIDALHFMLNYPCSPNDMVTSGQQVADLLDLHDTQGGGRFSRLLQNPGLHQVLPLLLVNDEVALFHPGNEELPLQARVKDTPGHNDSGAGRFRTLERVNSSQHVLLLASVVHNEADLNRLMDTEAFKKAFSNFLAAEKGDMCPLAASVAVAITLDKEGYKDPPSLQGPPYLNRLGANSKMAVQQLSINTELAKKFKALLVDKMRCSKQLDYPAESTAKSFVEQCVPVVVGTFAVGHSLEQLVKVGKAPEWTTDKQWLAAARAATGWLELEELLFRRPQHNSMKFATRYIQWLLVQLEAAALAAVKALIPDDMVVGSLAGSLPPTGHRSMTRALKDMRKEAGPDMPEDELVQMLRANLVLLLRPFISLVLKKLEQPDKQGHHLAQAANIMITQLKQELLPTVQAAAVSVLGDIALGYQLYSPDRLANGVAEAFQQAARASNKPLLQWLPGAAHKLHAAVAKVCCRAPMDLVMRRLFFENNIKERRQLYFLLHWVLAGRLEAFWERCAAKALRETPESNISAPTNQQKLHAAVSNLKEVLTKLARCLAEKVADELRTTVVAMLTSHHAVDCSLLLQLKMMAGDGSKALLPSKHSGDVTSSESRRLRFQQGMPGYDAMLDQLLKALAKSKPCPGGGYSKELLQQELLWVQQSQRKLLL